METTEILKVIELIKTRLAELELKLEDGDYDFIDNVAMDIKDFGIVLHDSLMIRKGVQHENLQ